MSEIGQVLVTPPTVRPGETCEVRVLAANNAPLSDFDDVQVDINGQCGPHQFLQFPATGRYGLQIIARSATGEILDSTQAEVVVSGSSMTFDADGGNAVPILHAAPDPAVPYRFVFSVGETLPEKHPDYQPAGPRSVDRTYTWEFDDGEGRTVTEVPWIERDLLWKLDHRRRWSTSVVSCRITPEGITVRRTLTATSATYVMQQRGFGVPIVRNDPRVEVGEGTFTCVAYIHNVGGELIALTRRSVTPHGVDDEGGVPAEFGSLGEKVVLEPGTVGVVVTQLRGGVDVPWSAPGVTLYYAGESESGLPVRALASFDLPLRPRELPHRIDIGPPESWPWEQIEGRIARRSDHAPPSLGPLTIDRQTGTVSGSIAPTEAGLEQLSTLAESIADCMRAPFEEMIAEHEVPGSALVLAASKQADPPGTVTVLSGDGPVPAMPSVGQVDEGQICDPDNIGDTDQASADLKKLTCALSSKTVTVVRPGRWALAHKGDIILSPGDSQSLVADVLAAVTPSQPFSHSGIMTRNFDEITHSTASEGWLLDHKSVPGTDDGTDGLQPEALHYIWPGVVAQSAQASIEGEDWTAPDNGNNYSISSFSPTSGSMSAFSYMPAMLVMPDPLLAAADPSIRKALRRVADGVRSYAGQAAKDGAPQIESKSHYRFYCFTDPRVSETEIVPAGHGWASGTFPSVCSVVIWREMRRQSLRMESATPTTTLADLELPDVLAGAMATAGTLDGLYFYTAAERRAAAQILFDKIKATAYAEAGWFGEALTDASDDTANQVVNTFAGDDVNGKDSDDWQSTGGSDAVSPSNILWWDGPERGGFYGFAVPAAYIPPRPESYRLSTWHKFEDNATVSGYVRRPNGTPVDRAILQLVENRTGASDGTGRYEIDQMPYVLPEGSEYTLTAAVMIDQNLHTASRTVLVNQPSVTADITLNAPPTMHRRVTITPTIVGGDDEDWPEDDESYSGNAPVVVVELSKDTPYKVVGTGRDPIFRWGGEVRVEHSIELSLLPGAVVMMTIRGWLYEGTSESTSDKDFDGETVRKVVDVDVTDTVHYKMWNKDENEPDTFSDLTLTVTNAAW